jgi:type II secretory ATPase GspE/PulE/Tfp pilus assembly ATPase PilB-like protein
MALTFLWLYCAEHADRRIKLQNVPKAYSNLAVLFGGPIGWLVLRFLQAELHTKDGLSRLTKKIAQNMGLKNLVKEIGTAQKEISVVLCTSDGKTIDRGFGESLQDSNALTLARQIVDWAIDLRASDILLDPKADKVYNLRFRVDGLLREPELIDQELAVATINCFKILGNVNIAERRRAQDGALLAIREGQDFMLRVATAGTHYGEKIAIRVLNTDAALVELNQTGMSDQMLQQLRQNLDRPHGMILVCGPTGSGKTTTLYSAISELAGSGRNIITVEDPIEYPIEIASQTEVNPKAGITFAGQLKHILRQTPDVIMVGEIRDAETARIALQSCETGHLVFSTLHANDALTGLIRLIDLGIEPFLIGAGLACIMSQRLVRILCENCCKPAEITKRLARAAATRGIGLENIYVAKGCEECGNTGYYGRTGIFEMFDVSPEIGELLNSKPSLKELRDLAQKHGMIPMQNHGITKVLDGTTSLHEVLRVTVK